VGRLFFRRALGKGATVLAGIALVSAIASPASLVASARPVPRLSPTPQPQAAVINVTVINAERAAATLRALFPNARIRVDRHANAVVVVASPDDVQQMRTVIQGIDVKNPQTPTTEVVPLHVLKPAVIVPRLRQLYPNAHIEIASRDSLLVRATPQDLTEIKSLISSLDIAPATPMPTIAPEDTVHVVQANPRTVARTLVREIPDLRASVSGGTIILVGSQDAVQRAKTLAQQLDAPPFGAKYTQIYRLHNVDATSVGDLVTRSYPNARVTVDKDINAISVFADAADQEHIASAIQELDAGTQTNGAGGGAPAYGDGNIDVVNLKSTTPGQQGAPSTTASDIAQAVQQSLGSLASDLHITPLPDTGQIVLAGSPQSIRLAEDLIAKLDVRRPLVALDTEVLEVDENVARNLGLEIPGGFISTIYSEVQPTPNPLTGQPGQIGRLQAFTRTPISFAAVANFLIQKGNGRVLADPRVTTVSGRPANITAGDQINILTQTGGGITPITQQLQQFQTGVTLDITPIVTGDDTVMVSVHPRVSSAEPGSTGVPNIAQREVTTVVQLHDNDTLVIGGLIQEQNSHVVTKIPLLGDIPLIGRLFQNIDVTNTRNELIIAITPHILRPGEPQPAPNAVLPVPTQQSLPTLPPGTVLPGATVLPAPHAEPSPTIVPTPQLTTPVPTTTPLPQPTPSAFAQTNVFTYGSPPSNTYAADNASPQIFYVQFSPTVLANSTAVHVFAVTSTNVTRVTVGYQGRETALTQTAPSQWQANYNFNTFGFPTNTSVNLVLSAYATFGSAATVQIPVNVLGQ
jgi:type II secretory pathway component GspD/PulD (secretin)